jgi:preprotein translocase subunit SecY
MFSAAVSIFKIPDLRNKVLFTIALLIIYRIGFHISVPGIDVQRMTGASQQQDQDSPISRAMEHLQMLSGGEWRKSTLFGLGILPLQLF